MGNLIIINGDDEFLKERSVQEEILISLMNEVLHFRLPEDLSRYTEILELNSLDSAEIVTVIWNVKEIPEISENGTTIIVSSHGKTLHHNRAKRVIDVRKLKPYNDGEEYIRWILKEGERLNIDLSRIASALYLAGGMDLRKICSEIGKIRVLSNPDGTIDPSLARRVMCFSAEVTPKHVVDAICDGHPAKALAFYDKLQQSGDETGWVLAYMQRHVLQQIRLESAASLSVEEASASLGVPLHIYRNVLMPRVGLWDVSSLRESLRILCNLDLAHKRGIDISRWGLELEIIRLAEESGQNVKRRGN